MSNPPLSRPSLSPRTWGVGLGRGWAVSAGVRDGRVGGAAGVARGCGGRVGGARVRGWRGRVADGARVCAGGGISYTICPMAEHPLAGTSPSKIIAVHVSYRSRAMERGALPPWPSYFLKPPSTLAADGDPVRRPPGCELLAFEGEVALVIGARATRVSAADAWSHVRWVTAANDFGVYDLRYADRGANVRSKGVDGFTPVGPALLDARAVDPERVTLRTWVNGELAQDAVSGDDLLFSFADIVADLSRLTTLEPGDVILTGTPTGSTVVRPGDLVEVEVSAATAIEGEAAVDRAAALADRRGRLRARPAGRDAERRRRPARGRLRQPRRPRPGRSARRPAGRGRPGLHRHARLPAPQARLQPRHPRPAADHPAEPEDGRVRPDAALRPVPRGPVRAVRNHRRPDRAERPEARGRAGQAGRDPGHRGARRPHGRHRRRHPRAARPGPRGRRHRHRRRDQGRGDAADRPRDPGLLRGHPPGRARAAARAVGGQRRRRLRRGHRRARRHHRRRRGRRHRGPARTWRWRSPATRPSRSGRRSSRPRWSPRASPSTGSTRSASAGRPPTRAG